MHARRNVLLDTWWIRTQASTLKTDATHKLKCIMVLTVKTYACPMFIQGGAHASLEPAFQSGLATE